MRIKNLDTGEEYDLEDFDSSLPTHQGPLAPSDADPSGSLSSEELQARGGKQAKVWLKGTKKLKTWAKSTLSNVRERIEERIERQHEKQLEQRHRHQPHSHQQATLTPSQPLSQEQLLGQPQAYPDASLDVSGSTVSRRGVVDLGLEAGSVSAPAASATEEGTMLFTEDFASTAGGGAFSPDPAQTADSQLSDRTSRSALAEQRISWAGLEPSFGGALRASPEPGVDRGGGGRGGGGTSHPNALPVSTSAMSSTEGTQGPLTLGLSAVFAPMAPQPSPATPTLEPRREPAAPGLSGIFAPLAPPRPLASLRAQPTPAGAGPSGAVAAPPPAAAKPSGADAAGPPQRPGVVTGSAGRAATTVASDSGAGAAAGAGTAGGTSGGAATSAGPPVVPLISLGCEPGPGHQPSEELRTPLLEEDQAGPSSRAVPTARSWLNQPARVISGRRGANRQLQQVRMIQELLGHDGAVWAMKFSADARLLATAGRDGVLRVWSVYWYPHERSKLISTTREVLTSQPLSGTGAALAPLSAAAPRPPSASSSGAPPPSGSGASFAGGAYSPCAAFRPPLLSESPLLALYGHRGDVLDLSWSQCRLLLTASADQTARLWYIDVGPVGGGGESGSEAGGGEAGTAAGLGTGMCGSGAAVYPTGECLRSFVHPDFVTSCCFHPTNPRRIVTGCADGKIRVWSVPDAAVVATATVQQDLVTRVLWSVEGSRLLAGTLRGKARHYEFTGAALDYLTQLDVKNAHGSGRKVTGLAQVPYTYGNDQVYVITSADSRIRLYVGYTQERKFKGLKNTNTQIAASLSPNCQHLISGSDDGWVYLWETGLPPPPPPPSAPGTANQTGGGAGAGAAAASGRVAAAAASAAAAAGALAAAARSRVAAASAGTGLRGLGGLGGGGKVKEGTYEAFQTPETTSVVALFAPNVCRLGRGLERQSSSVPGSSGGAGPLGTGAAASGPSGLIGSLFVVAGFSGRIYVYENLPAQAS